MSTRAERRLQTQVNTLKKGIVGQERIWKLGNIAEMMQADADLGDYNQETKDGLAEDALFLKRLAWDLQKQHDAILGRRPSLDEPATSRYNVGLERGPRP